VLNPLHLRTLETVLRTGSFAHAARSLGYSGSAVSQQMSALEREVRAPLFERDAHGVRPTPLAEFIVERARESLGRLRALEDDIALLLDGAAGGVRLGSFPTASEYLLPRALASFMADHAAVEVTLDEGEPAELLPLVESGEVDLALVYQYGLARRRWPSGLKIHRLLVEDLLLLVPEAHPIAAAEEPDLSQLAGEKWVSTQHGSAAAAMLTRSCANAGFEPEVGYRSNNYAVVRGLVATGLGIALTPALGHETTPGVASLRLPGELSYREVLGVRRHAAGAGPWRGMLAALQRTARELAGEHDTLRLPA
jgi:DNA-binding transcriptional LysR family regulator